MLETTYQPMWFASAPSAHCSGKVWPAATDLLDFLRETYLHTRTCVKKDGAPSNDRLRILELGSGTGYAGLTLMRTLSASTAVDITMTEMLDAGAAHRLALNIRLNAGVVGLRLENREEKDQDVTLGQDCISTPLWWVQTSDAVDPMAIGTVGRRSRLRALPMDWADVVVSLDGAASLPPQLLTEVASSSSSPGIRSLSPSPPSSSPNWLDEARVTLEREGLTGDVDNDVVRVPSPKPTPSVQAVPALPTKVPPPPHDFDLLVGSDLCYNDVSVALLCRAVSALLRRHAREDYVSDGLGCEARCFYAHTVGRWGASGYDALLLSELRSANLVAIPCWPKIFVKEDWAPTPERTACRVVVFELRCLRADDPIQPDVDSELVLLHARRSGALRDRWHRASMTEEERDEADACGLAFGLFDS